MDVLLLRHLLLLALLYPSELHPMNYPWQCPPDEQADEISAMPTNQQMQLLSTIGNMVPQSRFPPSSFVQSNPFMSGSPCNVIMLSTESGQRSFQKNQNLCHLLALKNSKTIQLGSSIIAPVQQYPYPLNGLSSNPFFSNSIKNQLLRNDLVKNYFLYNHINRHSQTIPNQIVIGHPDLNQLETSSLQDILLKLNIRCSGGRICTIDVSRQNDKIFTSDRSTEMNVHRLGEKWAMENSKLGQGKGDCGTGTAKSRALEITGERNGPADQQIQENGEHHTDVHPKNPEVTTTDENDTMVIPENNERQLKMENPENTPDAERFVNPMENPDLFEGDILGVIRITGVSAITKNKYRWPNGIIPYSYEARLKNILPNISQAMKHIEQNTCIKFEPYDGNQTNHVYIIYGNDCSSHLGMKGGNQTLSLGKKCGPIGVILHELLHTMGFYHEHTRSDRDDFLIIYKENIKKGFEQAFEKLRPDENRLINAFDYDSIMLYDETAFSKDGTSKTIAAKKPGITLTSAFDKTSLSPSDIDRINILYDCPSKNGTMQ